MVPLPGGSLRLFKRDGARGFVIRRARFRAAHRFEALPRCARGQHVAARLGHARKDLRHLRGGLSGGKNHLRHSGAQRAMMIELGESQVFKRQVLQPLQRVRHGGALCLHFVQQRFNLRAIHQRSSFGCVAAYIRIACPASPASAEPSARRESPAILVLRRGIGNLA